MEEKEVENRSVIDFVSDWLASWKFSSFMLFLLFFFTLFLSTILFIPDTNQITGSFARDFKIWCFGYDPNTGKMETIYVAMLILDPLFLGGIIAAFWHVQLKEIIQKAPKKLIPYCIFALALVVALGYGFTALAVSSFDNAEKKFPATGLRTSLEAYPFSLTDHRNKNISLESFRGKVIILTSFYTACGKTCPTILFQAKRVLNSLTESEKSEVKLIAITLDPKKDTNEIMKKTAKGHGLDLPNVFFVNGNPDYVELVLDKYSFNRKIDPKTGEIDHANLFMLIDRKGKIAYRFTLGELQEKWQKEALKLLVAEK